MDQNPEISRMDWVKSVIGLILFVIAFIFLFNAFRYFILFFMCGCVDFIFNENIYALGGVLVILGFYDLLFPIISLKIAKERKEEVSKAGRLITELRRRKDISRYDALKLLELDGDGFEFANLFKTKEFQEVPYYIDIRSGHIELSDKPQNLPRLSDLIECPHCHGDFRNEQAYIDKLDKLWQEDQLKPEENQLGDLAIERLYNGKVDGRVVVQPCILCDQRIEYCRVCNTLVQEKQNYCGRCNYRTA